MLNREHYLVDMQAKARRQSTGPLVPDRLGQLGNAPGEIHLRCAPVFVRGVLLTGHRVSSSAQAEDPGQ